ncbi:ogr/Delta-like zinc finger family protein [Gilvimarinus japonicus]
MIIAVLKSTNKHKRGAGKLQVICKACDKKAAIYSRKEISKEVCDLYCSCRDPECGHTFVVTLAFKHTLSPSARDGKNIALEFLKSLPAHERQALLSQSLQ